MHIQSVANINVKSKHFYDQSEKFELLYANFVAFQVFIVLMLFPLSILMLPDVSTIILTNLIEIFSEKLIELFLP